MTGHPLWIPSAERRESSNLHRFMARINRRFGLALKTYEDIHGFSITRPESFWNEGSRPDLYVTEISCMN